MDIKKGKYWDRSWNPIEDMYKGKRGWHCTKCSPGCLNCWAEKLNMRFGNGLPYGNAVEHHSRLNVKILSEPFRRKKRTVYFVCDLMDLFHGGICTRFQDCVYRIMGNCEHIFLVLTKRPIKMLSYINRVVSLVKLRFDNVWHGLTICNQEEADRKLPYFVQVPGHKWLSIEPMLGPIDLTGRLAGIDWVVVGGESGPGARPMKPSWVRSIRDQCQLADVPFFFKQWGAWKPGRPRLSEPLDDPRTAKVYHWETWTGPHPELSYCVGKKKAGRLLDGRTWDELPKEWNHRKDKK